MSRRTIFIFFVLFVLTACGGGGDDEEDQSSESTPISQTPIATLEGINNQGIDVSNNPLPRGVQAKDGLTLLASNHFVQNERLYAMFLVRYDGQEVLRNVRAIVTLIDENDLRLATENAQSAFSNIQPGQVVAVQGEFPLVEYFDGISAIIVGEAGLFEGLTPYLDAPITAEIVSNDAKARGTAENASADPLVLQVAYFVLYGDTESDLIAIIPAVPVAGLDQQNTWQPGVTISYEASLAVVPDLSTIQEVELLVVGYAFSGGN